MSKSIMAFFLVCSVVMSYAQRSFNLQGTIRDSDNRQPISKVHISINGDKFISNAQGNFSLQLKEGNYTIEVTHPRFNSFKEYLNVDQNLKVEINLEHRTEDIERVVLNVKHRTPGAMIVTSLDKKIISRNISDNLGALLTHVSGVEGLKTGNNIIKPIIHGMYGSRVAILNNGVKMAEQEWGIEHAPNVDIGNYQHIDVVKGASALKFGNEAIGGIVLLEPAVYPKKDSLEGNVIMSGQSNGKGGGLNVSIVKLWKDGWALNTNGSYHKLGDLATPDYGLMNTGMESSSFNFGVQKKSVHRGFSLDYYLTHRKMGILRATHIGSVRGLYEAINSSRPIFERKFSYDIDSPQQVVEHHLLKLNAYDDFKNLGKIFLTYSFQYNHRQEYDVRRADFKALPALDMELMTHQINVNHLLERHKWSLESGVDVIYQNNYSDPMATKSQRLIPNYNKYTVGAYSVFKYKFNPHWNVEAAGRYDFNRYDAYKWYNTTQWEKRYAHLYPQFRIREENERTLTRPLLNYHNLSFNAGLEYKPSSSWRMKFNYARVDRAPNIAELLSDGIHHSAAMFERGDLGLKNETGSQLNFLLESNLALLQGLQISINPYFFYTRNYINQVPTGVSGYQGSIFPEWTYKQIDAKMFGVDVDIQWKLSHNWTYKGRGAYLYGQDITHDTPLILMPPFNLYNEIEFSRSQWHNFYISVNSRQVFRQNRYPYNPVYVTLYNAQGDVYQAEVDLSTPPKAYSLFGIQAGIDLYKNFSAGLIVNNLFNTNYRDYLNRLRFFSDETGRNFILQLKYNF
ncbi:TonB-dependent receptor [Elizabethkingia argentiflava]|uniref:TonB-dependent receptor n=1 Tax=Elizabethkingia argenteiflava TaxID=2681556 RepID=A0A845PZA7_9FLAO|nr:TonB-dependent receptor [Elizabethkingia argenteiflava]NAW51420.1 TonB-dependent receptor [Elizabethkingia argenteiflava]